MGLFDGKKKADTGPSETGKKARQRKKTLALDQQIADLQIKKANAAGDRGSGEGGGDFWTEWYGKDWDW